MMRNSNRPICSPTVERLLLEIEGQAVKSQPKLLAQPRNYTKENIKRLKEIQENCKKREIAVSTPTKAVPISTLKSNSNRTKHTFTLPKSTYPNEKSQIVQESNTSKSYNNQLQSSRPTSSLRRSSSQTSLQQKLPPKCDNSLKKSPSLIDLKAKSKTSAQITPTLPHTLGTVPKYLQIRKQKWKEEEDKKQEAMKRDLTIPPGHSLMSEKERLETLALLRKTQADLLHQLIALPVQIDTMRAKQRKEEIEKHLKKAEDGINIFSKSRVLIKND